MLTVTEAAKEKLKEAIQREGADPKTAVRVTSSPSMPDQLKLVLDKEKKEDHVVKNEEGAKILLVAQDLAPMLKDMVLDYKKTPREESFTIYKSKPASGA